MRHAKQLDNTNTNSTASNAVRRWDKGPKGCTTIASAPRRNARVPSPPTATEAAGILLTRGVGPTMSVLMLYNPESEAWDIPKGLRIGREAIWLTALRELAEETGLQLGQDSLEHPPLSYGYSYPPQHSKHVYAFHVHSTPSVSAGEVRLSSEHSSYRWMSAEQISEGVKHESLRSLAHQVMEAQTERDRSVRMCTSVAADVMRTLRSVLRDALASPSTSWYLAGSFATGEHTVYRGRLESDIDLVCVTTRAPSITHVGELNNRIAEQVRLGADLQRLPSVSTYVANPRSPVNLQEPFWASFQRFAIPLGPGQAVPHYRVGRAPDHGYHLVRLAWHALSPRSGCQSTTEYRMAKSLLLARHLSHWQTGSQPRLYQSIGSALRGSVLNATATSKDTLAYQAYDWKVRKYRLCSSKGWQSALQATLQGALENRSVGERAHALAEAIVRHSRDDESVDLSSIRRLLHESFGVAGLSVSDYAQSHGSLSTVWYLLAALRVVLWNQQLKWSKRSWDQLFALHQAVVRERASAALPLGDLKCVHELTQSYRRGRTEGHSGGAHV